MADKMTIPALQQMKRDGKKSIGVVAWDYQIARIADRAGVDFVSVGDSVGVNLWGRSEVSDVTMDEMLICCKAVRAGVERALVSCDMPYGPAQEGIPAAITAACLLVEEGGADMIKVDAAAEFPGVVTALAHAGIPVFAQFGLTPQTAIKYGIPYSAQNSPAAQATAEAAEKLETVVSKKSGLLGVSELSNDMRDLREAIAAGNRKARLAVEKFTWTIARWIGSYVAELDGLDMLVFTGGIGENDSASRAEICAGLGALGIELDEKRNNIRGAAAISAENSRVTVKVIPPLEDLMIVNHVLRLLGE